MVRVTGYKSNSQLMEWIKEHSAPVRQPKRRSHSVVYRATKWRPKDRLTEVDVVRLVMAYQTGIATKELAKHYGINVKSVPKLVREHAIRRRL
jgi:hypothetical protein